MDSGSRSIVDGLKLLVCCDCVCRETKGIISIYRVLDTILCWTEDSTRGFWLSLE